MPRPLRALLPATERSSSASDAAASSKRKRSQAVVACEACRKKKSKCDAERPTCRSCELRGSECVYDADPAETRGQALRRKFNAQQHKRGVHEEFHQMLRFRPEVEVVEILRRVRAGVTIEDIVRHVRSGDLLLQLSVSPERRYHYSLGRVLNIPDFLRASNQYTTSLVYRKSFDPKWHWSSPPQLPPNVADYRALYEAPFHVAEMVDADIDAAEPSKWTSVSSDDALLRDILKSYFMREYLFFPFFHKDSFLQDMISGRRRFCSSLLVNAVFMASCHNYSKLQGRSEFWNPESLTYRFIAETRRLWELETDEKSITRVQAALILQGQYSINGLDKISWPYIIQAVATSEEIGLFTTYIRPSSRKWRAVQEITAWIVFSYQAMLCLHLHRPPLITTRPALALPDNPEAYGEIWVKYPTASTPVPLHLGQIFKTNIGFRTILFDILCSLLPSPSALEEKKILLSVNQATEYHSRLRKWYEELPSYLSSQNLILPVHFDIHMHYWFTTARLFEQVSVIEEGEDTDSPPMEESTGKIITGALANLQTLIRLYYSCHGSDSYDPFLVAMCSYIGFGALHAISLLDDSASAVREVHESTALLCAGVLHDQSTNAYIFDIVFRLMQQSLPPAVAAGLVRFFHISDVNQSKAAVISRHVQSSWPVTVAMKPGNTEDRRLDNLLRAIKELSVDDSDDAATP